MSEHTTAVRERAVQYIEDPISTTEHCRYSLMCRHVCPVGHVTHSESLTPHGWALLIASVRRQLLTWNEDTVDLLYKCADCGLCQSHCATDQPLPTGIAAARAEVVASGLAPAPVTEIQTSLQRWGNPYGQARPEKKEKQKEKGEVALYVGDASQYLRPSTLSSVLQLIDHLGIEPVLIGAGRSSGFLASSLGLTAVAFRLAEDLLNEVKQSGCRRLLVLAPGDRYAFTVLYTERLNLSWPEIEVIETTALLGEALRDKKLKLRKFDSAPAYAYHDPCHSPRVRRDHQIPRQLLEALLGRAECRLFWREQRAHPCGAAGGLELIQPELARKLAESRFQDVNQAGASWLITEDPLCLSHLEKHAPEGVEVKGLYELLAEGVTS